MTKSARLFELLTSSFKYFGPNKLYRMMYPGSNPLLFPTRMVVHYNKITPLTPVTREISDHVWFKNQDIFVANMMKKGNHNLDRPNNAFKMGETNDEYMARLTRLADKIVDSIRLLIFWS